ncbi:MAG: hypothetical protein K9M03_02355 [Kiritimatiellales bacterium]|nr:hypothetical protein [Kiritimatiellales bacterium]
MSAIWIILGIALPTVIGWLIVRLLEGKTPVLFKLERWILGFVLGLTFTMFITFLIHITTGMGLNRMGYLGIQLTLTILLGIIFIIKKPKYKIQNTNLNYQLSIINSLPLVALAKLAQLSKSLKIIISILISWTTIKILLTGITFLILTPPFLGDTVDNWNLRGKMYFVEEEIVLTFPGTQGELVSGDINTYPPTVPLAKASFAAIAGNWNEPLVNIIHLLWYLAALSLVFFALCRVTGVLWALGGTYILSSIPLYLMHGTNPYADVFLSVHIFAAVSLLFNGIATNSTDQRRSFLRLAAFATALLPFTKNEALIIHTPAILLVLAISLWWMKRSNKMSLKECVNTIIWYAVALSAIVIPWIMFKLMNDLTFGNAQSLSDIDIAWQPNVLSAIAKNTLLEGNWLLLFPLMLFLLIVQKSIAFKTPLAIFTGFFLIVYLGQFPLYMFTYLSTEALYQTGYARGIIQLVPVMIMIVTVLLAYCVPVGSEKLKVKSE